MNGKGGIFQPFRDPFPSPWATATNHKINSAHIEPRDDPQYYELGCQWMDVRDILQELPMFHKEKTLFPVDVPFQTIENVGSWS